MNSVNDSTLGLYSFKLFTDMTWSMEHLPAKSKPLVRCRAEVTVGKANIKRPAVAAIPSGVSHISQKKSLKIVKLASPVKQLQLDAGEGDDSGNFRVNSFGGPVRVTRRKESRNPY